MGANAGGEVLQELCLAPLFPPASPRFLMPFSLQNPVGGRSLLSMNQTKKLSGPRCDTAGMGRTSHAFSGSRGTQSHPSPSELTPVTQDLMGRGPGRAG